MQNKTGNSLQGFSQELLGPQGVCSRRGLLWWQCNKGGNSLQVFLQELLGQQGVCRRRGLLWWQSNNGGSSSEERHGVVVGALHEILAPKVSWAPHLELVYRKQQDTGMLLFPAGYLFNCVSGTKRARCAVPSPCLPSAVSSLLSCHIRHQQQQQLLSKSSAEGVAVAAAAAAVTTAIHR